MSGMKHVILIDEPDILSMKGDGTVAKEMTEHQPFLCTRCNGSGYVFNESRYTGELLKEQCPICLGYGELKARILIEWIPFVKR